MVLAYYFMCVYKQVAFDEAAVVGKRDFNLVWHSDVHVYLPQCIGLFWLVKIIGLL